MGRRARGGLGALDCLICEAKPPYFYGTLIDSLTLLLAASPLPPPLRERIIGQIDGVESFIGRRQRCKLPPEFRVITGDDVVRGHLDGRASCILIKVGAFLS